MSTHTDASILDTMTPEELEAIKDDAGTVAEDTTADADEDDDSGDGEVLDADGNPVGTTEVIKPAEEKPAAAPAAKPAEPEPVAEAPTPQPEKAPTHVESTGYRATLPADYAAQVQEVADKRAALVAEFKEGTLEFDEYNVRLSEVNAQAEALVIQRAKAEISQESSQQAAERQWNAAIAAAMDRAMGDGIDYRTDEAKGRDLDTFVRVLGNDPKNETKPMQWFLDEAHKRVLALHGMAPGKAAPALPAKPAARKASLEGVPVTLAQVPGADGPGDVSGDSFAHLDSLDGEALEQAIAKMTPAQRENFTRGI